MYRDVRFLFRTKWKRYFTNKEAINKNMLEINMNFFWKYNGLACLTPDHEVAGSIPGTSRNFKCGLGLERGPPSLVRTIG